MKIQQIQNQQSFGMALYMPPKNMIAKKIGSYAAEHAETARYKLELLAKDVDIEVTPKRAWGEDARYDQFDILVTEISQSQNNFRERLLNFIRFPKYENSTVYVFEDYPGKPLFQTIIEKTTRLKEKLIPRLH